MYPSTTVDGVSRALNKTLSTRLFILVLLLLGAFSVGQPALEHESTRSVQRNALTQMGKASLVGSMETPILTWSSHEDLNWSPLNGCTVVEGDHVLLRAHYSDYWLPPGSEVTFCEMAVYEGSGLGLHGRLIVPDEAYDPFNGMVQANQCAWQWVSGIGRGYNVTIELDFTNNNTDLMVWWADTNSSDWSYGNNLMAGQMTSGTRPEIGAFVADRSGTLAVCIYDRSREEGNYTLWIDRRHYYLNASSSGDEVLIDTYSLGNKSNLIVLTTGYGETGPLYGAAVGGVTVCNLFAPRIISIRIDGLGVVKNLSWSVVDRNAGESHVSEVWLSSDSGVSFQLLASNLTESYYLWDSTGFFARDTYLLRVRTRDSSGLYGEARSTSFSSIPPGGQPVYVSFGRPDNVTYMEGSTGNHIPWQPDVVGPFDYEVFRNGTNYANGVWSSSVTQTGAYMNVNVDGLNAGVHMFRIVAVSAGYSGEDTVYVTVTRGTGSYLTLPSALITGACVSVIVVFSAAIARERSANR